MMKFHIRLFLAIALTALFNAACSTVNGPQETLVAENAILSTQIVEIRGTATIVADQLAQTAEYIQTAVRQAEDRRGELSATLQATGVDPTSIAQVSPNSAFVGVPTTNPQAAFSGAPATTPGTPVNLTVLTPTPGQPTLFGLVTANGVGDNDCALAAVNIFSINAESIYVVATAANVTAGTVLGAQWYQNNVLLVSQDFTPDFDINDNCIWFFIDQTDFVFTAGSYSVQLTINGVPVVPGVVFSVNG